MADIVELQNAYEAILLRNFRGQIDREQRNAEIEAVDASPLAARADLEAAPRPARQGGETCGRDHGRGLLFAKQRQVAVMKTFRQL